MRFLGNTLVAALLAAAAVVVPGHAAGTAVDAPAAVNQKIGGHWTGAKLRCQ